MWKYKIRKKKFKDTVMYYVCEDFGEFGHTDFKSAGLLCAESKSELKEMLSMMLLDCDKDAEKTLSKIRKKYTKTTKTKGKNDTNGND